MNNKDKEAAHKNFSVLNHELDELATLYRASAAGYMEIHSECFDCSKDYKWIRICNVYPESEAATLSDSDRIVEILDELHILSAKATKEEGKRKARRRKSRKPETKKEYSEDIKQKAFELVCDPAFLFKFGSALEKGMYMPDVKKVRYVLGEEDTKRHLAVNIATAGIHQDTINLLHGDYATVKDTMVRMILRLTGIKYIRRGYLTAAGQRYSEEIEDAVILYLPEADLRGEKGRQMRFMRSDDGGFEIEYAHMDKESGLMVTETKKAGVKTIIVTTNDVTFNGAIASGAWLFQTDDSADLTEQVVPEKLKDFVKRRQVLNDEEISVWNCAFELLSQDTPEFIEIPYASDLFPLFDTKRSEVRRSPEKVCELIQKIAILRRYQKPVEYRTIADVIDLFTAMRIGKAAMSETVTDVTTKEREVYGVIEKAGPENRGAYIQAKVEDRPRMPDGVTVKQISMALPSFPSDTCYRLARSLTDKGYLAQSKRGRENEYFIKNELAKGDKDGISRMRSLEKPEEILEECMRLVIGKNDFGNSETPLNIADPITGKKFSVRGISEITEIKSDETEAAEGTKSEEKEKEDGIRVTPTLEGFDMLQFSTEADASANGVHA